MARRRFFVDEVRHGAAELTGEDAQHLSRVLRAEAGQRFEISDNGSVYLAEISEVRKDRVRFRIVEPLEASLPPLRITLVASLIKFDRFEWIVEKATELGVEAVQPVGAERSDKGLLEAARKRVARWRKIARESSQQSRRVNLPKIGDPERLASVSVPNAAFRYVLEERPDAQPILAALPSKSDRHPSDTVWFLVGPEGGWTDTERDGFRSAGWTPVSLGPQVLRAETAAIAALAILANAW